jgi:4-hydroxy-2-oxoheptanedioate aldolase
VNRLKERVSAGKAITIALITTPSVGAMQIWANSGVDMLIIDMEHGHIGIESVHALIAATAGTPAVPVVRVPWNVPWLVKPVLDAGAMGIVFPMIANASEADAAVRSTLYPPAGERGWGPFYAPFRWGSSLQDYVASANADLFNVVLAERPEALENIAEISAVPGIDMLIIAPFDLATIMGHPNHPTHPEVAAAIAAAETTILASGVPLGGAALTADRANELIAKGYRGIVVGFDWMVLQRAIAGALDGINL